jgi:acyl-coenzyme A thioesterase PaaI-like protein
VVSRSTRTSFARAEVHDPRGRLMAHATSTCLLMSATD